MIRKLVLAAVILFGATWLMAQAKPTSFEGVITDTMCGAKHTMMKNVSDKECTLACVKMGSAYGLVVGDKVYELDGKAGDLEKFAGAKAKVTGTVDGAKIHVTSVSGA